MPCLIRTPLRLGLAGGGTDVPPFSTEEGGCVVNAGLQLYVYVLAKWRHDDTYRVSYTKTEIVDRPEDLQHDLAREVLLLCGIDRGVELITVADIPGEGSGLGSSSAVTVGILHALHVLKGERVLQEQLAEEACEVECGRLRKGIGKQDQYGAALGGINFLGCGPGPGVTYRRLPLPETTLHQLEDRMALYWVQAPPPSGTVLRKQVQADQRNTLRQMREDARSLAEGLSRGDAYRQVAGAVRSGWEAKRGLCDAVSCAGMDTMADKAFAAGADAVKLCGAGGGGYMLVCAEKQAAVAEALGRGLPVKFDCAGSTVLTRNGQ